MQPEFIVRLRLTDRRREMEKEKEEEWKEEREGERKREKSIKICALDPKRRMRSYKRYLLTFLWLKISIKFYLCPKISLRDILVP